MSSRPHAEEMRKKYIDYCKKENAFYKPKTLFLLSLLAFIFAFFVARFFNAIQQANLINGSPNIINGFHFHHWSFSLIALLFLIPMAYYFREKKEVFGFLIIIMSFFLGLFIDGIVYPDSAMFFIT